MTTNINLAEIRNEYSKAPQFSANNTHEAYIVKLWVSKRRFTIGVNYWTKEEAANGTRMMSDTKCEIIAPLYEA
jgi:hypothetical protein